MRIRTLPASITLLAAAAALTGCATSGGSHPGATATTPPAAPATTKPAAPAFRDGQTISVNGSTCIPSTSEVAQATGLNIKNAKDEITSCAYTEDQPTYAVQNVNFNANYVLPSTALVGITQNVNTPATPIAGYPAGTQGYQLTTQFVSETFAYLPKEHVMVTCWTIGTDGAAALRTQQALCRWAATGNHLLKYIHA